MTDVSPGLLAWDAINRRGATSEARSEPTGRPTHLQFSIKTCFAAPLLGESEAQLHASSFCCTPPEIELL